MHCVMKQSLIFLVILSLILVPVGSTALADSQEKKQDFTASEMMADAVLVRPVGVCAMILGAAIFVVSLPFSAIGGNTRQAYEKLVVSPAKYTFKRPLGDI